MNIPRFFSVQGNMFFFSQSMYKEVWDMKEIYDIENAFNISHSMTFENV